jgi:hypothetical protein
MTTVYSLRFKIPTTWRGRFPFLEVAWLQYDTADAVNPIDNTSSSSSSIVECVTVAMVM